MLAKLKRSWESWEGTSKLERGKGAGKTRKELKRG